MNIYILYLCGSMVIQYSYSMISACQNSLHNIKLHNGIIELLTNIGRFSPRNQSVAEELNEDGLATLLFDLLTAGEEKIDNLTRQLWFDINLFSIRLSVSVILSAPIL
jgi:hypothetical protein